MSPRLLCWPAKLFAASVLLTTPLAIAALAAPPASASPRFHVECPFHHHRADDPIVFPRQPGASHLHAFFGNKSTRASSTFRSLRRAGSTCGHRGDKGAYWIPAVYKNGRRVRAVDADFYYRGKTTPFRAIRAFPRGLKMLAGNGHATRPQRKDVIGWSCHGSAGTAQTTMRDCGRSYVKVLIHFPSCWDGVRKDSRNHKAHMRYAVKKGGGQKGCPRSHPVPLPELTYAITLPFHDGRNVRLASGPFYTMHADFWNAWKQVALRRLVHRCIHAGIECKSFEA